MGIQHLLSLNQPTWSEKSKCQSIESSVYLAFIVEHFLSCQPCIFQIWQYWLRLLEERHIICYIGWRFLLEDGSPNFPFL